MGHVAGSRTQPYCHLGRGVSGPLSSKLFQKPLIFALGQVKVKQQWDVPQSKLFSDFRALCAVKLV